MRSREVRLARRPQGEPVREDFELADRELAELVVEGGIEAAPGAFADMLAGRHLGKVMVRL